jgi:hypothetical protein
MTDIRRVALLLTVVVAVLVIGVGSAHALGAWKLLGERVVNDRLDHDTIVVTAAEGNFTALKLTVQRRPVHFLDMKVNFANGETQDVQIRAVIPAGGETRVLDLAGGDRVIRSVEFTYEANSIGVGKRAHVRLFGRR